MKAWRSSRLGIDGKRALWRSLEVAAEIVPELRRVDFAGLAERALEQRRARRSAKNNHKNFQRPYIRQSPRVRISSPKFSIRAVTEVRHESERRFRSRHRYPGVLQMPAKTRQADRRNENGPAASLQMRERAFLAGRSELGGVLRATVSVGRSGAAERPRRALRGVLRAGGPGFLP